MQKTQLDDLTELAKKVKNKYQENFPNVKMDRDYLPFKMSEEWGECLQAYLMLTDRGRQKDKTKDEIREMLSEELADVFGYILLFAENEKVDLATSLKKKWGQFLG